MNDPAAPSPPASHALGQGQGEERSLRRLEEAKGTRPLACLLPRSSLLWGGLPLLGLGPAPGTILSWTLYALDEEKVGWAPGEPRLRQI